MLWDAEEKYYGILEQFESHFQVSRAALIWLARASATRSQKLLVPKSYRNPKAICGNGGYATAFKDLGLILRPTDTKSGHWHYWYYDANKMDFKALQRAISRRWKGSSTYSDVVVS